MLVRDLMTRQVVTATPDASIRDVARLMSEIDSGVIPIVNDEVLGIITDRDIVVRAVAEGRNVECAVSEIMTSGVESCLEDDDLHEASLRMSELQMRRLLVFDHSGNVSGILTLGDIAGQNDDLAGVTLEDIVEDDARK